jgi:hypothetical protein
MAYLTSEKLESEDAMKDMWKTKTFWVGVVAVISGLVAAFFPGDGFAWPGFVALIGNEKILLGIGMITGRQALKKLES